MLPGGSFWAFRGLAGEIVVGRLLEGSFVHFLVAVDGFQEDPGGKLLGIQAQVANKFECL